MSIVAPPIPHKQDYAYDCSQQAGQYRQDYTVRPLCEGGILSKGDRQEGSHGIVEDVKDGGEHNAARLVIDDAQHDAHQARHYYLHGIGMNQPEEQRGDEDGGPWRCTPSEQASHDSLAETQFLHNGSYQADGENAKGGVHHVGKLGFQKIGQMKLEDIISE